ncbi:hypothetical protein FBQ81_14230 [Chloroflexi bacterium CFX6]|nr:hypothetical protein [Chloroflexi bacterium CFX6]
MQFLRIFYGLLLNLFPRTYREEYGEELQVVFDLSLEDARKMGEIEFVSAVFRELLDLPGAIIYEHLREMRRKKMTGKPASRFDFEPGSQKGAGAVPSFWGIAGIAHFFSVNGFCAALDRDRLCCSLLVVGSGSFCDRLWKRSPALVYAVSGIAAADNRPPDIQRIDGPGMARLFGFDAVSLVRAAIRLRGSFVGIIDSPGYSSGFDILVDSGIPPVLSAHQERLDSFLLCSLWSGAFCAHPIFRRLPK